MLTAAEEVSNTRPTAMMTGCALCSGGVKMMSDHTHGTQKRAKQGHANGSNNSGSQQGGDRANVVPGVPTLVHQGGRQQWLNQYLNPAAFAPNPPGTFGNTGRNPFITPTINSSDAAFMKNWTVEQRYGIQFRWEMFNVFNHPSFGGPNTDVTSSNFGQITSTGAIAPRVMQAAIKLKF